MATFPTLPAGTTLCFRYVGDSVTNADASLVPAWPEVDGKGDAVQATAGNQAVAVANAINGHKALDFDGSNAYALPDALLGSLAGKSEWTMFVVQVPQDAPVDTMYSIFMSTAGATGTNRAAIKTPATNLIPAVAYRRNDGDAFGQTAAAAADAMVANTPVVITGTVSFVAGSAQVYKDGTLVASGTAEVGSIDTGASISGAIGGRLSGNTDYWIGLIAEVILIEGPVTDATRASIHSYFQDQYAITVSDYVASGPTLVESSDSTLPVISETSSFDTVIVSANDDLLANVSETSVVDIFVSSPDDLTPFISETSAFDTVAVSSNEDLAPAAVESTSNTVLISSSDSLTSGISDVSSIGTIAISSSEIITPVVLESFVFDTVAVSGGDTLVSSLIDTSDVVSVIFTSSDTITPALAEEPVSIAQTTTFAEIVSSDPIIPVFTEGTTVDAYGTGADILSLTVIEASGIEKSGLFEFVASETLTPAIVDQVNAGDVSVSNSDIVTPALAETSTVAVVAVHIATQEALTPSIVEASSFVTVVFLSEDVVQPGIIEDAAAITAISSTDTALPAVVDDTVTLNQEVIISSSDTVTPILTTEHVSLKDPFGKVVKVWNGTHWIQGRVGVWRLNSWRNPTIKIWNGKEWA